MPLSAVARWLRAAAAVLLNAAAAVEAVLRPPPLAMASSTLRRCLRNPARPRLLQLPLREGNITAEGDRDAQQLSNLRPVRDDLELKNQTRLA